MKPFSSWNLCLGPRPEIEDTTASEVQAVKSFVLQSSEYVNSGSSKSNAVIGNLKEGLESIRTT